MLEWRSGSVNDPLLPGVRIDQQPKAAAHDPVVVCDEDPHVAPMVSSMVVPSPGVEKIARLPPTSSAIAKMFLYRTMEALMQVASRAVKRIRHLLPPSIHLTAMERVNVGLFERDL